MSASPAAAPTQSTKRPLEDPSSPSAPNDQPEAKRPALDKIVRSEAEEEEKKVEEEEKNPSLETPVNGSNGEATTEATNGAKVEVKDEQDDTFVPDAPAGKDGVRSIESTGNSNRAQGAPTSTQQHDESGWIHIRAVITSAEAATVIGKGGENVSLIRKMSGAKCTVSDYQKGAVERILTVSGVVDAAAKVAYYCFV